MPLASSQIAVQVKLTERLQKRSRRSTSSCDHPLGSRPDSPLNLLAKAAETSNVVNPNLAGPCSVCSADHELDTEEQKRSFVENPEEYLAYRKAVEREMNSNFAMV